MPEDSSDLVQHLTNLKNEHRELDQNLQHLAKLKYADQLQMQSLKRQKLKIKDQITRLESDLIPDLPA